ncbi:MAG: hypothetical protein NTX71_00875 [Candidatus Aureabacteria bacterium]|nr:hypothetical protein [Candidatus Auribacterota bacterium]
MFRKFMALFVIVPISLCLAGQSKRPSAPKGFSWKHIEDIKGIFLVPDGWHFKSEFKKGIYSCFITKENIDEKGEYQTGLAIHAIKKSHLETGIPPSKYASQFINQLGSSKEVLKVLKKWRSDQGSFKGFGLTYEGKHHDKPITVYNLLLANDKTGTLSC